jgi:hypothetical protein
MTQLPSHPGEDGEEDSLWSEATDTQEVEPDDTIAEPDMYEEPDANATSETAPRGEEIPPDALTPATVDERFPTISPARHPAIAGHALCLVARVVYGAAGTEPTIYLSASVDHQLPESAASLLMAQMGDLPDDLVAVGHAALVRFAAKQVARQTPPKPARAKPTTPAKPTSPLAASVPPTGPRPTNVAPLTPATAHGVEQLDLFSVAEHLATTPLTLMKEDIPDGNGDD